MPSILVVDDNKRAAEDFARLISLRTKLVAIPTSDPEEALKIVNQHSIKVAVLDQRMPEISGTELFKKIVKIDPLIKGLMLTGEADTSEVAEALGANGGYSDYLHKSEVTMLPQRVLLHYCAYHTDMANVDLNVREPFYTYKARKGVFFKNTVQFFFISFEVLAEEHVFEDKWRTSVKLNAGETQKYSISYTNVSTLVFHNETSEKLGGGFEFGSQALPTFKTKLDAEIGKKYQETRSVEESRSETLEREVSLPAEPAGRTAVYTKSQQCEYSPVYRKMRIYIRKECSCCRSEEIIQMIVYQITDKISTRIIDFYSDDSKKITSTGSYMPPDKI